MYESAQVELLHRTIRRAGGLCDQQTFDHALDLRLLDAVHRRFRLAPPTVDPLLVRRPECGDALSRSGFRCRGAHNSAGILSSRQDEVHDARDHEPRSAVPVVAVDVQ